MVSGETVFASNKNFSKEELTELVRVYKSRKTTPIEKYNCFNRIRSLVTDLIHTNMHSYNMYTRLSRITSESIFEDCSTVVLLKAIRNFKSNYITKSGRPANFTTVYVKYLKNYLAYKNKYYKRRISLENSVSLSKLDSSSDASSIPFSERLSRETFTKYAEQESKVFCGEISSIYDSIFGEFGRETPCYNLKRKEAKLKIKDYISSNKEVDRFERLREHRFTSSQIADLINK